MSIDLSYLKKSTGGEPDIMKEMAELFISQINEISTAMKEQLLLKDWEQLGKLAHKAKTSVAIMGMRDLAEELKQLEILIHEQKNEDQYERYVAHFNAKCLQAIDELNVLIPGINV